MISTALVLIAVTLTIIRTPSHLLPTIIVGWLHRALQRKLEYLRGENRKLGELELRRLALARMRQLSNARRLFRR